MSVLFQSKNIKQLKMNPKQDYLPFKISRMSIISQLNTRSTTILRANNPLITSHYRDIWTLVKFHIIKNKLPLCLFRLVIFNISYLEK